MNRSTWTSICSPDGSALLSCPGVIYFSPELRWVFPGSWLLPGWLLLTAAWLMPCSSLACHSGETKADFSPTSPATRIKGMLLCFPKRCCRRAEPCSAEGTYLRAEPRRGWELSEREVESPLGSTWRTQPVGQVTLDFLHWQLGRLVKKKNKIK